MRGRDGPAPAPEGSLPSPPRAHRVPSSGAPLRFSHARSLSLFLPRSSREDAHIRVKRYRQSINNFPHFQTIRTGCRFGTCTVQKLAHQIYQLTDKDKDDAAPASKISPQGYGRRRRSLPERRSPPRSPQAGRHRRTRGAHPLALVLGI